MVLRFTQPVVQLLVVKRWCVYGLVVFFLILGIANLVRAGMAAYVAPVFQGSASLKASAASWSLALPIEVLGGIYLFWGAAFVGVAVMVFLEQGYWTRRKRGRGSVRRAFIAAVAYQGTLWALHLAYRSTYAQGLWLRDGILTGLFLATVAILGRCIQS